MGEVGDVMSIMGTVGDEEPDLETEADGEWRSEAGRGMGVGIETVETGSRSESTVTCKDSRPWTSWAEVRESMGVWNKISSPSSWPGEGKRKASGSGLGVALGVALDVDVVELCTDCAARANVRSLLSSLLRSLANRRLRALACCFVCPCMYPGA